MINKEIKTNLEKLFFQQYEQLKNTSIERVFEELIAQNPSIYEADLLGTYPHSRAEITQFKQAKENQRLISAFEKAKNINGSFSPIVAHFQKEIIHSLKIIGAKMNTEPQKEKNQLIFLEHDSEPIARFYGFGEGTFPLLETPNYLDFTCEELYNRLGKIDYTMLWKDFIALEKILEQLDVLEAIYDVGLYTTLKETYQYKTYLLLFEAFDTLSEEVFHAIPIQKPLYIYGNEHDCEAINLYVYE